MIIILKFKGPEAEVKLLLCNFTNLVLLIHVLRDGQRGYTPAIICTLRLRLLSQMLSQMLYLYVIPICFGASAC